MTDASTPPSDETIPADATAETAVEQDVAAGGDALTDEAPADEAPAPALSPRS
ncbi:MAG: hypothetical protein IE924_01750, partial [Microbacterium sp.]|nr:hypothetical protein [Microbacterium sp.]